MASLTIRNFDDKLKMLLRLQAAQHGCSMEQEARDILRSALASPALGVGFAQKIHQRFAAMNVDELPIPKRNAARLPDVPKD